MPAVAGLRHRHAGGQELGEVITDVPAVAGLRLTTFFKPNPFDDYRCACSRGIETLLIDENNIHHVLITDVPAVAGLRLFN